MAARGRRAAVRGEIMVQVDEHGTGKMALLVRGPAGAAVEVRPHVGEHDPAVLGEHPRGVGDRIHHQFFPSVFPRGRYFTMATPARATAITADTIGAALPGSLVPATS